MSNYNVVLLTVDCLRFDRCGFNSEYSSPTPFLDHLAKKSIIWESAYSTGPMTPESVPGFLCGLHSHNSAQTSDDVALKSIPESQPTIASWLLGAGYETYAALSNIHLTSRRNYDIGFETFWNPTETEKKKNRLEQTDPNVFQRFIEHCRDKLQNNDRLLSPYSIGYLFYRIYQSQNNWPSPTAEQVVEKIQSFISPSSTPFFVWGHFMDVHGPYHPDTFQNLETYKGLIADCGRGSRTQTRWLDEAYDSTVSYVDYHIKKVVNILKATNQWENTILIMTSDHGEALFDRGWFGHVARHYLFEELLHVPLLVRHPDWNSQRISSPFSLAWLNEIIAEAIDESRPDFPSKSYCDSHLGNRDGKSPVLADGLDEQGHSVAAIGETGKYIAHSPGVPNEVRSPVWHDDKTYYDLQSDPLEKDPLSESQSDAELISAAREKLTSDRELRSLNEGLSDNTKARLRDIGYLS